MEASECSRCAPGESNRSCSVRISRGRIIGPYYYVVIVDRSNRRSIWGNRNRAGIVYGGKLPRRITNIAVQNTIRVNKRSGNITGLVDGRNLRS